MGFVINSNIIHEYFKILITNFDMYKIKMNNNRINKTILPMSKIIDLELQEITLYEVEIYNFVINKKIVSKM